MSNKFRNLVWLLTILLLSIGLAFAQDNRKSIENCQKEVKKNIEKDRGKVSLNFATPQVSQASRYEDSITGSVSTSDNRETFSYTCTVDIRNSKVVSSNYSGGWSSTGNTVQTGVTNVEYYVHYGNVGWVNQWFKDSEEAGFMQPDKGLQAIRIAVPGLSGTVRYQVHVGDIGWMNWVKEGRMAGTVGQSKDIQAIKIELVDARGYGIEYSVYADGIGWSNWVRDGEIAGTTGQSRSIRSIKMRIFRK